MLGTFIANVFFPRRDLVYFELYFEYWRRATAPATNRLRLNNSREAWIIRLMIFLCCLEFLKYTYIVGNQSHSITTRILLYDGFSLLLPNQDGLSAVTLIGIFMIIQLAWLTYFKGEKWAFESLGDMILRNRAPTFLWRDGNPLNPAASRKNVCDQLIRFVRLLLPFGQLITVFVYILLCIGNFLILQIIIEHLDELAPTVPIFIVNLTILTVNTVIGLVVLIIFKHILMLNCATGLVLMRLATLRMGQIDAYLRLKGFIATWTRRGAHKLVPTIRVISRLHWIIITNLEYIGRADRGLYSKLFFTFLVCSVPITLNLIYWTLLTAETPFQGVALSAFTFFFSIGLFGVHHELANYGTKIHAPAKVLYSFLTQTIWVEGLLKKNEQQENEEENRVQVIEQDLELQDVPENGDWDVNEEVVFRADQEDSVSGASSNHQNRRNNVQNAYQEEEEEERRRKAEEDEEWRRLQRIYTLRYNAVAPVTPAPRTTSSQRGRKRISASLDPYPQKRLYKNIPLHARLKLSWMVTTLGTTHSYGSTYGPLGTTVTHLTVHKFIILFCKLMLNTFKMHIKYAARNAFRC